MRKIRIDIRMDGPKGNVCGWGVEDNTPNDATEKLKIEENLHCTSVRLLNEKECINVIPLGDFRRKLFCGVTNHKEQAITLVITFSNLCVYKVS